MKSQSGITLTSLVIYVIVMIIVMGVMSLIINNFYKNSDNIEAETEEIVEFNNFNTYFLKEIKKSGNGLDTIQNNYILFTSGNSFSLSNNKIYYNDIQICKDVEEMKMETLKDENGEDIEDIIHIEITFKNFKKSINYKIEEIY